MVSRGEERAAQRICVGCKQRGDREVLMRLVLAGDPPQFVPDVARSASGRGVSVHPNRRCLEAAVKSGALRRGLKTQASADAAQISRWASGQYRRRAEGLLGAAHRSGRAAVGTERVRDAIARRDAALLIVASDAENDRNQFVTAVERLGRRCLVFGDKAELGRLFARQSVAVVAITDSSIAEQLQEAAHSAALLDAEAP